MRVVFAVLAVYLLDVPGLVLVGGLMLAWVCWKMWSELRASHDVAVRRDGGADAEGDRLARCGRGRPAAAIAMMMALSPESETSIRTTCRKATTVRSSAQRWTVGHGHGGWLDYPSRRDGAAGGDSALSSLMAPPRRHLSMLRSYTPADALTIGNASCGTLSIFLCLDYMAFGDHRRLWIAIALLPAALVCDVLDGYVARLNRARQSLLGADLDSLADVISFGVAPAVLGFTLGLRGGWDMLCLVYFVVCGVSRLARFNVTTSALTDVSTGKVTHFEGTPIPTSIVLVALLAVALWLGRIDDQVWFGAWRIGPAVLHPLALVYALSGSAMISATLRIPKP